MSSEDEVALAFADEQLRLCEEAAGEENEMASLYRRPSAGQGYMLVTNRLGVAQLDQDSAFIVSRIQFLGTLAVVSDVPPDFPVASQLGFSVRDAGSSIIATISKWKQGLATGFGTTISNDVSDSNFACTLQLVPQFRDPELPSAQMDYVYTLSARWIVPRGSSIRVEFPEMPGNGFELSGDPIRQYRPQVMFKGRKVYG